MLQTVLYSIGPIVFLGYLGKRYFSGGVCTSKNRLDGKIVIITGANCGIGYETALDLAKRGAHVILACRDLNKANEAADKIIKESKNENVFTEQLDLSDFQSIKEFCERIKTKYTHLDILINNAGLISNEYCLTEDGIEKTFQANHLGHFLLTNLLIDLLIKSTSSRVVNLSCLVREFGKLNLNDINNAKEFNSMNAYTQSKFANVLFTQELAKRYKDDGLIAVSLHPGLVRTDLWKNFKGIYSVLFYLFQPLMYYTFKNASQGAQTSIHCAVADEVAQKNGSFFSDCREKKILSYNDSAERLWNASSTLIKDIIDLYQEKQSKQNSDPNQTIKINESKNESSEQDYNFMLVDSNTKVVTTKEEQPEEEQKTIDHPSLENLENVQVSPLIEEFDQETVSNKDHLSKNNSYAVVGSANLTNSLDQKEEIPILGSTDWPTISASNFKETNQASSKISQSQSFTLTNSSNAEDSVLNSSNSSDSFKNNKPKSKFGKQQKSQSNNVIYELNNETTQKDHNITYELENQSNNNGNQKTSNSKKIKWKELIIEVPKRDRNPYKGYKSHRNNNKEFDSSRQNQNFDEIVVPPHNQIRRNQRTKSLERERNTEKKSNLKKNQETIGNDFHSLAETANNDTYSARYSTSKRSKSKLNKSFNDQSKRQVYSNKNLMNQSLNFVPSYYEQSDSQYINLIENKYTENSLNSIINQGIISTEQINYQTVYNNNGIVIEDPSYLSLTTDRVYYTSIPDNSNSLMSSYLPLSNQMGSIEYIPTSTPYVSLNDQILDASQQVPSNNNVYFYNTVYNEQQIKDYIRNQIEYYFSDENLEKDYFLKSKMNEDGFVQLDVIAAFKRVKSLSEDFQLILNSVKSSEKLELLCTNEFLNNSETIYSVRSKTNPTKWTLLNLNPEVNEFFPDSSKLNPNVTEFVPNFLNDTQIKEESQSKVKFFEEISNKSSKKSSIKSKEKVDSVDLKRNKPKKIKNQKNDSNSKNSELNNEPHLI